MHQSPRLLAALFLPLTCCGTQATHDHMLVADEDTALAFDGAEIRRSLAMTDGTVVPWCFSITSKGNGLLDIANLQARIYDSHDDGVTFDPWLLRSTVIEDSRGRCSQLELTGTRVYFDEKDAVGPARHAIHVVCRWNSATKTFAVENDPWGIVLADRGSPR